MYYIVTTRDCKGIIEEFERGATESLKEARKIAQDELYRIERDKEKCENVEIRVYEDEGEKLDYDTMSIEDASILKSHRERRGMSQSELAKESGVNVQAIQHYEQGFRDLNGARAITVKHIADALGCRMEDLIEE